MISTISKEDRKKYLIIEWKNLFGYVVVIIGIIIALCNFGEWTTITIGEGKPYPIPGLAILGSITGMLSVWLCNLKKGKLVALTNIPASLYVMWYAMETGIYVSAIMQVWSVILCSIQLLKWNKMEKESKYSVFVTKYFTKEIIIWISLLFLVLIMYISMVETLFNNQFGKSLLDTTQSAGFQFGGILMMLGNIWGFAFFILADLLYLILDVAAIEDFGWSAFIMHSVYTLLAIQGVMLWKK